MGLLIQQLSVVAFAIIVLTACSQPTHKEKTLEESIRQYEMYDGLDRVKCHYAWTVATKAKGKDESVHLQYKSIARSLCRAFV